MTLLAELTEWFDALDFDRSNEATRIAEFAEMTQIVSRHPAQERPNRDAIAGLISKHVSVMTDFANLGTLRGVNEAADAILNLTDAQSASVRAAAERVCRFDWSDNDMDAVAAIEALRKTIASAPAQATPDTPMLKRAVLLYLSVFDACDGSESVSSERFADARHAMREAVAEVPPSLVPSTHQSASVQRPPHNSGERLPSGDAAGAGADTLCTCGGDLSHDYHEKWCPAVTSTEGK